MQVNRRKETIFFVVLVAVALFVLTLQIRKKKKVTFFSNVMDTLVYPIHTGIKFSVDSVVDVWLHYFYLTHVYEENITLKKKVAEYEHIVNTLREHEIENQRLKKMLRFKENVERDMIPARIVGKGTSSWFKILTIDKGTNDGVMEGLAVVSPKGVVGHIVSTSHYTSNVLIISDINSGVAAFVQRNRTQGIVSGGEDNICEFRFVKRDAYVKEGDLLISSGLGGIFPKALAVGTVTRVSENKRKLFQDIDVSLAVDFSKIEEVFIIRNALLKKENNKK